jgi:tellurite resistance protein TehA-like permease
MVTTPASGAVVMGTGIVSVALASDNRHTLSLILLVLAAALWAVLAAALIERAVRDWPRVRSQARMPAALTSVAATAVLGARATGVGWSRAAVGSLGVASALWLILLPAALLRRPPIRSDGVAFMVTVSAQSLAVLAAQLAVREHAAWLLYLALALLGLGLALYGFVLARFHLRQLVTGQGDQWVSGGALAISALAAARITLGARALNGWGAAAGALPTLTLTLWALSAAWLPALLVTELVRPRLSYDVRRWATVFPVGMYAACSFDTGRASGVPGLITFAQVWVWVAFVLWLVVFVAMVFSSRGKRADTARYLGGGQRVPAGSDGLGPIEQPAPSTSLSGGPPDRR